MQTLPLQNPFSLSIDHERLGYRHGVKKVPKNGVPPETGACKIRWTTRLIAYSY